MPARIHSPTARNLRLLAARLQSGEPVAIPTETVYGLAGHALDDRACRAIFRAKGRPANDPLIVHVLDLAHAEELAHFNDVARELARQFWPGPLTLVLPRRDCIPDSVTAGGDTVALRAPAHPLARELLRLARVPLAAPSANLFGYISPTTAAHVVDGLGRRIRHVLDGGPCPVGVESTVLDITRPARPRILRPGAISAEDLAHALPAAAAHLTRSRPRTAILRAPGLLERHYSPRTPLRLVATPPHAPAPGQAVILVRRPRGKPGAGIFWLSARGALPEIARELYRVLRETDRRGFREILIEPLPPTAGGLAVAINDRIRRACARG